jgi:2-polyprenyl-3-methyl-5-hydroxy-6-metoxy-1,4-benzoquinol methylase
MIIAQDKLINTECFFCAENQQVKELYSQNFSEKDLSPEVFSARRTTRRCHYRIVKCKCGLVFSNPVLPEDIVSRLYKQSSVNYGEEIKNIQNSYLEIFRKIFAGNLQNISVLEFGSGNGFFLKRLLELGVKDIAGIEPGVNSVENAHPDVRPFLKADFIENVDFGDKKFHVVCSFQTIDHVRDPLAVLKKCHELLKPGGACIFVMHDTESLQAKILKDKSPIIDIEHIFLFNKKTGFRIFEKTGFEKISVLDVKNFYTVKYWLSMLPLPEKIKNILIKPLEQSGVSKISIGLKAGNIAVIGYRKDL